MNTTRAAILVVIAAAVGFGIFQFLGGTGGGTGPVGGTGDPARRPIRNPACRA